MSQGKSRWTGVPLELVKEILREAEEHLKAQLQCGIASDQRAMQLIASATALAAAVLAAVVAWASTKGASAALWASLAAVEIPLALAIICAAKAAWPVDFYYPGTYPNLWSQADLKAPIEESLGQQADHYDEMLQSNDVILRANGKLLKWAMALFGLSPFVALMAYAAVAVLASEEVTAVAPDQAEVEMTLPPCVPAEASEEMPKSAASDPPSK